MIDDKLEECLNKITTEFESIESFVENDTYKSDRFKSYLKKFYDYLKINESLLNENNTITTNRRSNRGTTNNESLPELIIDSQLVDNEQIYQQLQLYNNETSSSLGSLAKFFSKCLVAIDSVSFNVELKKSSRSASENGGTTTDNLEDDDSNNGDEDDEEHSSLGSDENYDDNDNDDDANLSDDSVDNMLKNSKIKEDIKSKSKKLSTNGAKVNAKETEFGIPDGSDSEIEDFEVNPNQEDEEEDEDELDEEEENEIEQEEEEGDQEEENDDIDSDEVDEDLVDLYTDLGDEKEVMGIGKPSKSFNQIDFDKEDFGLNDDEDEDREGEEEGKSNDYDNEPNEIEKESIKNKQKQQTRDLFNVDNEQEDEEEEKEKKSSFEIRQSKLKEQVDDIHKSMLNDLTDKSWQLSGETTAKTRPKESLLEEFLEFDHTTRKAPINSGKTTEELEALIKQRIKDKAFDDVERKIKPVEMNYEFKKEIALDHEKSKIGLGEVYEQDFLKQQNGAAEESKDKVNPKHDEIRKQMQNLFIKLDALSNFHYTPKAPAPEIKVISNMPTITMEEVAPISVADSNALAPEEIKKNIKKLPKSKSEEDKKDKKKNLRSKKMLGKKKKAKKENLLKIKQALNPDDPKLAKEMAMNKLVKQSKNKSKNIKILKPEKNTKVNNAYRSSHAFFQQLQETNQINGSGVSNNNNNKKRDNTDKNKLTSKKLKL